MPINYSKDNLPRRFANTVTGLIKGQKEQRMNQFILPAIIAPSLLNSWVNYGGPYLNAGYYIDQSGRVNLCGVVKSGTINTTIFTLPAGFRPLAEVRFPVSSNGAFGSAYVDTSGNVVCDVGNNTYVSLDGIFFRTT